MAILNKVFERSPGEDVTKSLGNMFVSGVFNEGCRRLYFNMLMNFLREKKTIVLVNGSLSEDQHKGIIKFVRPHMTDGRAAYDLNMAGDSDTVDILSAFSSSEQKADFVVTLMSMVSKIPDLLKNKALMFYLYAIGALDALDKKYSIKELSMMDVDYVHDLVSLAPISVAEKSRQLRFLEDKDTYASFTDFEPCMVKLKSSGLLDMFSGDLKVKDMLNDGNIVMLNGMISDDFEKKELLFNALFYAMPKCLEKYRSKSKIAFFIKNSDFISGDYINNTLKYNSSYNYAAYIFVDDIARFTSKNGNSILDDSKSFLVFNQGSDENAKYWSAFFGNRDVNEKGHSGTKKRSLFDRIFGGGVVASPGKYDSVSTNFQLVNKPIYRPEIFRKLKSDEVMCYLREPPMIKKKRIEE